MNTDDETSRAQGFFHEHPQLLLITSLTGTILDINKAAQRALGPAFVIGAALAECVHPDERGEFEASWARMTNDGQPARVTCRVRGLEDSGATFVVEARRSDASSWVYVELSPAAVDTRGRQTLSEAAAAAEARVVERQAAILRTLLDHMEIVVWAMDRSGNYTLQEGKALGLMGLSPGQLVGQNMYELYGWEHTEGARRALEGEHTRTVVQTGDVIWESWLGPIRSAGGAITGAIGLTVNVTEAQRAKTDLEAKLELLARQEEVIRNLQTPILQVWDRVLTLPMVGAVDSHRASRVMSDLLTAVTHQKARFTILDLTGVDVVDAETANYLMGMIRALRLLGAEGILTGIRPSVAQTVVALGLDLSGIVTLASLREGLALAIRRMASDPG